MPAKDASRNGYEISVNDGTEVDAEVLDYIREQDKKFEVLRNCVEFIDLGRVFGIRVAMFMVDSPDPEYYTKPFNPDGVRPGSYKGISQIDPYWITPGTGRRRGGQPRRAGLLRADLVADQRQAGPPHAPGHLPQRQPAGHPEAGLPLRRPAGARS